MTIYRRFAGALLVLALILLPSLASGQKVTTDYDKSVNFARYKRYAWGANSLFTQQHPVDQDRIEMKLKDSIDRQLQSKGFVLADTEPDFQIHYDGGALTDADTGVKPDLLRQQSGTYTYTAPLDVWVSTLAKIRITVADKDSDTPIWSATASQKVTDRKKFMSKLDENLDKIIAKTLKDFPPGVKH